MCMRSCLKLFFELVYYFLLTFFMYILLGMLISASHDNELESTIKDLFSHLMAHCSLEQFKVLFLSVVRNGLVAAKVETGHYRVSKCLNFLDCGSHLLYISNIDKRVCG